MASKFRNVSEVWIWGVCLSVCYPYLTFLLRVDYLRSSLWHFPPHKFHFSTEFLGYISGTVKVCFSKWNNHHIQEKKCTLVFSYTWQEVRFHFNVIKEPLELGAMFCFWFFFGAWFVCSPGCPWLHNVDQVGLELRYLPTAVFWVLTLKVCATMFFSFFQKDLFLFMSKRVYAFGYVQWVQVFLYPPNAQ